MHNILVSDIISYENSVYQTKKMNMKFLSFKQKVKPILNLKNKIKLKIIKYLIKFRNIT